MISQNALGKAGILVLWGIFLACSSSLAQESSEQSVQEFCQKGDSEPYPAAFNAEDIGAYIRRGRVYNFRDHYEQAISDFSSALEIDDNYAPAYYNRGLAYYNKGDYDRALADFTQAVRIMPSHANAYSNRGLIYHLRGNLEQAIADYTKAIEGNAADGDAYNNRAVAYYLQKDYTRAWDDVHKLEGLRYKIPPKFLENLKKASGREIYRDSSQDR